MLLVINPVLLYHSFSHNGHRGYCISGAETLSVYLRWMPAFTLVLTTDIPGELKKDFEHLYMLKNVSRAMTLPSYPGKWGTERSIDHLLCRGVVHGQNNWIALDCDAHGYHPESAHRVLLCDPHLGFGIKMAFQLKKFLERTWDPYRPPVDPEWRAGRLEGNDWKTLLQKCEETWESSEFSEGRRFDQYLWDRLVFEMGVRDRDYCTDTTMIDVSRVPAIFKPKLKSYLVKNPEHLMSTPEHQDGLATLESLHHVFFRQVLGRPHRGEAAVDIWRD